MIKNLIESSLNLLFPPVCGICGKLSEKYLCSACYEFMRLQERNRIDTYEDKNFSEHFWIYEYKSEIRERIIDYKFNDKSYIFRTFVELILRNKEAVAYIKSFDIIVPVPIHKKRLKQRGYNQSYLIAKALINRIENVKLISDMIIKIKNVSPQSSLNKIERQKNILGAYVANEKYTIKAKDFDGKRILLIDDVYTTGSTLNECARVLKQIYSADVETFTTAKD